MSYQDILYERDGPIAIVTLNRPDKLNAYTATMGVELADAFRKADEDDDVRVVILTGAGRAFCAGADVSSGADSFDASSGKAASLAPQTRTPEALSTGSRGGFIGAMFNCRKATIVAFNGPAVGIGVTLALPIDIKIAADNARFGLVFTRRGLVPEAGSAWFLPKLVGLSQALKWCVTGKIFPAQEALDGGLVSELVPADKLMARAKELAMEIATETAPISVALTRQMLWRFGTEETTEGVFKVEGQFIGQLGRGPDVREGVMAFLEKRKPNFSLKPSQDMPKGYPWWTE
jgi:enoyl-CoA hydratase/carnithine racemase